MNGDCQIVPWFDSKEWFEVYSKIYSTSTLSSKQEALETLSVWKTRCPALPAGIESTLCVLEVYIQDSINAVTNDQLLRLAYSSAMMRFVNHMLDAEIAKGTSLHQAAKILGVPDWIIDLRHDTAHNNILPSIDILRDAAMISLDWLQTNYWDQHKEFIEDHVYGQVERDNIHENEITILVNFCASLSICASSQCNIKNLSDITDDNMREAIVIDARDLFSGHLDFSNLKTVSVTSLINLLNSYAKRLLKSKDATAHVNKALTGDDSLFLSSELLNYLCQSDFHAKNKLSFQYVQCFEVLLTFLQTHDLLMDFVLELIKLTQQDDIDSNKRKLAALWVSEILQSLKKSMLFNDRMKKSVHDETKKKKELKSLFHHWFPNEKNRALLLNLQINIPNEWKDIKFIQPILSSYNPYLAYFARDLLNFVEPVIPRPNIDKICKLTKLISTPSISTHTSSQPPSKIYTIEDLQCSVADKPLPDEPDSDCMEICEEHFERCETVSEDQFQSGIWQKASQNYNWSACPIGLLPWQMQT